MKGNKQFRLILAALLLISCSFMATTFAYFTDSESIDAQVIQVGTIEVELYESQYSREKDGKTDAQIIDSAQDYQDFLETAGEDIVPGKMIPKCPYLYNKGSNPAYVRFRITVEKGLADALQFNWDPDLVGEGKEYLEPQIVELRDEDDKVYTQYLLLRSEPLPSQTLSGSPLLSVGLKPSVTSQQVEMLQTQGFLTGEDSKFTIRIAGDAIQTHSLDTVEKAFQVFATVPEDAKHG